MGISKDAYFRLTPAETRAICDGWVYNRDMMSNNFRMLFMLQFNQWSKQKKDASQLWPIASIDGEKAEPLTEEELYARNKKIIEHYKKITGDYTVN